MSQQDLYQRVASVPYLQKSQYGTLDVSQTLDYMIKRYIQPLTQYVDISTTDLVDCGAGFGWCLTRFKALMDLATVGVSGRLAPSNSSIAASVYCSAVMPTSFLLTYAGCGCEND